MNIASQIPAGAMYSTAQYADYKSKTKLHNVWVCTSWLMPKRVWQDEMDDVMGLECETKQGA